MATVLLTVAELDRLLDVHVEQDSSIMIHEFHTGVQSRTIRTLRAREEAVRQAVAEHPGPLADRITELLGER